MGLQETQKLLQRRVIVVTAPIRDIPHTGRSIAVADLAIDNTRQDIAGRGLTGQGNAAIAIHHAEHVLAIGIDGLDERTISRRCELVEQHVLNLGTWIASADQESFVLNVCPIDELSRGKRMPFRKCDHDPFRPQAHMRIVGVDVFAQYHDDVDGAAIEQRNQGRRLGRD